MAIIGRAITPNMAILVIMGVMARPIMAIRLTFMSVPGKYGQNVDHRWKRFWKRCILRDFMAKTKKYEKKMTIFGQFPLYNWSNLKSAGTLPQLTQSFWNFLGGLISSTYTYSQLSNIFIKKNEIQHHPKSTIASNKKKCMSSSQNSTLI